MPLCMLDTGLGPVAGVWRRPHPTVFLYGRFCPPPPPPEWIRPSGASLIFAAYPFERPWPATPARWEPTAAAGKARSRPATNPMPAPTASFPSLRKAAARHRQLSPSEFAGYGPGRRRSPRGSPPAEMMMLSSGPRERFAEELDRPCGLGGSFPHHLYLLHLRRWWCSSPSLSVFSISDLAPTM
jgi:hypothetical protein